MFFYILNKKILPVFFIARLPQWWKPHSWSLAIQWWILHLAENGGYILCTFGDHTHVRDSCKNFPSYLIWIYVGFLRFDYFFDSFSDLFWRINSIICFSFCFVSYKLILSTMWWFISGILDKVSLLQLQQESVAHFWP